MAQPSPVPKPARAPAIAPLLASEVLRDELAPFEPAARACRAWLLGDAVALALLGLALRFGAGGVAITGDAATIAFSAAGAIATLAALPFPYGVRAAVAVLVGAVLMTLGLRGAGPLAALAWDGAVGRDAARLIALCLLPPALIFRSRYPLYGPGRWLVLFAMLAAAPYAALEVALATDSAAAPLVRVAAAADVAAVLSGLLGFLHLPAAGAASAGAAIVLWVFPLGILVRAWGPLGAEAGPLAYPATAVALLCAALPVTVGSHQLLAWAFGPAARRQAKSAARSRPELEREDARG